MSKFRSHWLALFGGATLIALSMSTAFAGKPDGTNQGLQVSAFVHSLVGADDETDTDTETADETETADDTEVETDETTPSDHGECVAEVATNEEATGGENENHGGAVNEAARVDCQDEGSAAEPNTEEPTEDTDSEVEAETEDSDASTAGSDNANDNADKDEGDSSDD